MAEVLNPQKALIFRITHRDNLPWTLEHGLHALNGASSDPNFRNIGNPGLIAKRTSHTVSAGSGGSLSDYIPFYFTPWSMMLYNIHTGYNVPPVPNEEIVFLISSLPRIAQQAIPFVFTDQHAFMKTASFFTELKDLSRIDWPLLNSRNFRRNDENDPGRTDRYQAEALIWRHLPIEALLGIVSCNEDVNSWLQTEARRFNRQVDIRVHEGWYF
jgi:hypothetical protein